MKRHLRQDILLILMSFCISWVIVYFEVVQGVLHYTSANPLIATFFAGMFFTSVATTAPAIAVLAVLSTYVDPLALAVVGGAGAVCGDSMLFLFVRDRLSDDIEYLLKRTSSPRLAKLFHRRRFKWLLPFIGGLIIASPLPDELGVTLMGISKLSTKRFILLSFIFNAIGILLIGYIAHALS